MTREAECVLKGVSSSIVTVFIIVLIIIVLIFVSIVIIVTITILVFIIVIITMISTMLMLELSPCRGMSTGDWPEQVWSKISSLQVRVLTHLVAGVRVTSRLVTTETPERRHQTLRLPVDLVDLEEGGTETVSSAGRCCHHQEYHQCQHGPQS